MNIDILIYFLILLLSNKKIIVKKTRILLLYISCGEIPAIYLFILIIKIIII